MAAGARSHSVSLQASPDLTSQEAVHTKADKHDALALLSIVYLLLMLGFFSWLLFDTWIGAHTLPSMFGYDRTLLAIPAFSLVTFSVIGGALGATVNGIRSFLIHSHGFAPRYIWKYITAPWMGALLALLAYALLHSSMAVLGSSATTTIGGTQALANFAAGALAGYGSRDVLIWLDAQVEKLFKVTQAVPAVVGKTEEAATARLHEHDLAVGEISKVPQTDGTPAGTVIDQAPPANATSTRGADVDLALVTSEPQGREAASGRATQGPERE